MDKKSQGTLHVIHLTIVSGIPDGESKTQKDNKQLLPNLIARKQKRDKIPGRQGGVGNGGNSRDSRKELNLFTRKNCLCGIRAFLQYAK